jgi:RNA polymerase sigma-70 factor (ECF subfamily)
MSDNSSFTDLMQRLRGGDQSAAAEVFRRFAHRLIGLARSRLDARVRQKVDPEDVMQSALKSFFVRHADGQLDLEDWDGLWSMLVVITLRKCAWQGRYFRRDRRDVQREVGSDAAARTLVESLRREPTPEEAALLTETVERLMRDLDGRDRDILALSLQGMTAPEVSAELGYAERTVRRVREYIRKHLERLQAEADEGS